MTDTLEVRTTIHASQTEVYDFLCDFDSYAQYSDHISGVTQRGDGSVGTEYGITFSWWKITYTAWSKVIALTPHDTIEWELTKDISANGTWELEPTDVEGVEDATQVVLTVQFDPDSASKNAISLPPLVSFSWVLDKVKPLILKEAKRVLARVIEDLEDSHRQPELTIVSRPTSV